MAKIEMIIDDEGKSLEIINLDYAVGAKGVNYDEDIKIVKALFHYVPRDNRKGNKGSSSGSIGYDSSWNIAYNQLPSPHDSTMWGVVELIKSFQKYAHKMLSKYGYRVNISGTVKPSKGYALVGKNYSTIAALNVFAALGNRGYGASHIERIISSYNGIFEHLGNDEEDYDN
jgi:hypothetical protein